MHHTPRAMFISFGIKTKARTRCNTDMDCCIQYIINHIKFTANKKGTKNKVTKLTQIYSLGRAIDQESERGCNLLRLKRHS